MRTTWARRSPRARAASSSCARSRRPRIRTRPREPFATRLTRRERRSALGRRSRKRAGRPATEPQPVRSRRPTSEERNAEVRAGLEPLAEGERPGAVTVAAIVAFLLAAANLIAYVAGMKIDGERPAIAGIVVYEALLLAAAYGMWRA